MLKSVFSEPNRIELISRIDSVQESNQRNWGKMNINQMLKHCINWDKWIQGINDPVYTQTLLGKLIGQMVLKGMVKDDRPIRKNMPSLKGFVITEVVTDDIEVQKKQWIQLIADYARFDNPRFIHDFFGRMSREEIGVFAYKHTDHHLRQFGL